MREEQKRQFFAMKSEEPNTVKVSGKFSFSNLPNQIKEVIKKRLAEKDDVMARGLQGEIPGLIIDGKQVTRENLHEFEISNMKKKEKVEEPMTSKEKKLAKEVWSKSDELNEETVIELYKKSDLEKLSFNELKVIGKKFGTTDRSKKNLIKEILKLQK